MMRRMLNVRTPYKRSDWYDGMRLDPTKDNVLSMRDDDLHSKLRAKMAAGVSCAASPPPPSSSPLPLSSRPALTVRPCCQYSGKEVDGLEAKIDENVVRLLDLLETKYVAANRPFDFGRKAQYFTLDVISDLAFGQPFGDVATDSDVYEYIKTMEENMPNIIVTTVLPWLMSLLSSPLFRNMLPSDRDPHRARQDHGHRQDGGGRALRPRQEDAAGHAGLLRRPRPHPGRGRVGDPDADPGRLRHHGHGHPRHAAAHHDHAARLQRPPRRDRCRRPAPEAPRHHLGRPGPRDALPASPPSRRACASSRPSSASCPRRCRPRATPSRASTCLPAPTSATAPGASSATPDVWGPDAHEFRPERWLEADPEKLRDMDGTLDLVFGYGRWQCLGRNVAMMELNKVFVEVSLPPSSLRGPASLTSPGSCSSASTWSSSTPLCPGTRSTAASSCSPSTGSRLTSAPWPLEDDEGNPIAV